MFGRITAYVLTSRLPIKFYNMTGREVFGCSNVFSSSFEKNALKCWNFIVVLSQVNKSTGHITS